MEYSEYKIVSTDTNLQTNDKRVPVCCLYFHHLVCFVHRGIIPKDYTNDLIAPLTNYVWPSNYSVNAASSAWRLWGNYQIYAFFSVTDTNYLRVIFIWLVANGFFYYW